MKKIPQIELLRLLAMTGIFLYHVWSVVPAAGTDNPLGPVLGLLLAQGYLGVVVFNIVTGFVLALPHAAPQGRPALGYAAFFRRRFARICPQYYLSLLVWTPVALAFTATPASETLIAFAEHLFFVQTFDPGRFFSIAPALWWMGLLAQFYLAFPLLQAAFDRFGPRRVLVAGCLVCWGGWRVLVLLAKDLPHSGLPLLDYMMTFNLPARLPEFLIGMYLATLYKPLRLDPAKRAGTCPETGLPRRATPVLWAGALVFTALACLYSAKAPAPFNLVLLTAACLFTALAVFSLPLAARLGEKPLVVVGGTVSYSFYLVHQPILGYGKNLLGDALAPFPTFCLLALIGGLLAFWAARAMDALAARLSG